MDDTHLTASFIITDFFKSQFKSPVSAVETQFIWISVETKDPIENVILIISFYPSAKMIC